MSARHVAILAAQALAVAFWLTFLMAVAVLLWLAARAIRHAWRRWAVRRRQLAVPHHPLVQRYHAGPDDTGTRQQLDTHLDAAADQIDLHAREEGRP